MYDDTHIGFVITTVVVLIFVFALTLGAAIRGSSYERDITKGRAMYIGEKEFRCAEVPSGTNRNP